jgi:hypothetical protein
MAASPALNQTTMDDFEHPAVRRLRSLKAAERRIGMGEVIQLKVELTEKEFFERWKRECAEWAAVAKDMCERDPSTSAYDVSEEQRKRMAQRGEKPLEMARIYITGRGWLIER